MGEHKFLVRNCFEQIKHLVENCNLEIKIPTLEAPPPPTATTSDFSPQLYMDKSVAYYLMMNISPFQKGQLEPMECIEKALNRCFNAMDRMLDLNKFQDTQGINYGKFMKKKKQNLTYSIHVEFLRFGKHCS